MTQFYQLTLAQAIADYQDGSLTTYGLVKYYIKIKFAPGWKISIDPRKAIAELGITIHQFRRAIAKIRESISISLKTTNQLVGEMPVEKPVTPHVNKVTSRVNDVTPGANHDPQTTNKTHTSSDPPDIRSNISHISLFALDENSGQKKPKANRQELIAEEERKNFLIFAYQKVDELPKRPTLPKKWISANLSDLYSEFKKYFAPEVQKTTKDKQFTEWYELMRKLGHVTGQRVENGVQLVQMIGGGWIEYERKAKSWTLEYLRKCVAGR